MKTLEELMAIRNKMQNQVNIRAEDSSATRVVIGMATCGIAAGARPVLKAFSDGVQEKGLKDVMVTQTGCIGICQYEPVVEVFDADGSKTTYVHVTPDKVPKIFAQHIVNGSPVVEYTIGANAK